MRGLPQTVRKNLRAADGRLLAPFGGDGFLAEAKRCELDRLYQRISDDLDALLRAIGVPTSSPRNHANENKVLVGAPITATKQPPLEAISVMQPAEEGSLHNPVSNRQSVSGARWAARAPAWAQADWA